MSEVLKNTLVEIYAEVHKWNASTSDVNMKISLSDVKTKEINNLIQSIEKIIKTKKINKNPEFYNELGSKMINEITTDDLIKGKIDMTKSPILKMTWESMVAFGNYKRLLNK